MNGWKNFAICMLVATAVRAEDRSSDGSGNNVTHPAWGQAGQPMLRLAATTYEDGMAAPPAVNMPNPREISNALFDQALMMPNNYQLTDFVWLWGQFVDHDIVLTKGQADSEPLPIPVPMGDPHFDPLSTGSVELPFQRTDFDPATGDSVGNPRQQVNFITSFIDASNVYGSDATRAMALRSFSNGQLKTSAGNLLPFNTMGLENANDGPVPDDELFVAGDVRSNEHAGLAGIHTLFVREHNRLCIELLAKHPDWTDEQLYQRARKVVGALMQSITYRQWLPALLGPASPTVEAASYDPTVNPGIANEFATALYRLGHTMISDKLMMVNDDNSPAGSGSVDLRHAFFNPAMLPDGDHLEQFLKGMAARRMQEVDSRMVDELRNFLFGPPGSGGLDLASLNIQRGRDHGIAYYNDLRAAYGLPTRTDFDEVTSDPEVQMTLEDLYGSIAHLESWVGALVEDHMPGMPLGELLSAGLADQFTRLRDGDRFFYRFDPAFSPEEMAEIEATTLADIIKRNTGLSRLQPNVFAVIPEARLHTLKADAGGIFPVLNLRWQSDRNASYIVQRADLLDNGSVEWNDLTSMFPGDGGVQDFIMPGDTSVRFFRLLQYP